MFCSINSFFCVSQDTWKLETADNLDKFNFRIGALQSSRIGLTDKIEVSSLVLENIFCQNLGIKKQWWDREIMISTKHNIYYPNLGLNTLKKTHFKKWIGDTTYIPKTLLLKNTLFIGRYFKKCKCCPNVYLATLKFGILMNAYKNDSTFYSIKHPILYHRTHIFNNYYLWFLGIDLRGPIISWLDFSTDFNYLRIFEDKTWALEHKTLIRWKYSECIDIFGGYKLVYHKNFGVKKYNFYLLIDAIYKFDLTPQPKNGLFEPAKQKRKYRVKDRKDRKSTYVN